MLRLNGHILSRQSYIIKSKNKKAKGEQRNEHKVQQRESGGIWYGCGI